MQGQVQGHVLSIQGQAQGQVLNCQGQAQGQVLNCQGQGQILVINAKHKAKYTGFFSAQFYKSVRFLKNVQNVKCTVCTFYVELCSELYKFVLNCSTFVQKCTDLCSSELLNYT
jgi:hypothetical protein